MTTSAVIETSVHDLSFDQLTDLIALLEGNGYPFDQILSVSLGFKDLGREDPVTEVHRLVVSWNNARRVA